MAKIVEDIIIIKFSKIVRDQDTSDQNFVSNQLREMLEEAAQNLVSDNTVVEIERKN